MKNVILKNNVRQPISSLFTFLICFLYSFPQYPISSAFFRCEPMICVKNDKTILFKAKSEVSHNLFIYTIRRIHKHKTRVNIY